MNLRLVVALLALSFGSAWPRVAASQPVAGMPAREGDTWVSDKTGTLDPATRQQLDALIADVWSRTNTRFAVALVRDTGARSIEDYALSLFRQWELGESTGGRGALLVVAIGTRRSRIEVGTVTLATLSDDVRRHVLDDIFRPTARAEGPGVATLRAMEALRDRVAPVVAPTQGAASTQTITPAPVEMPSVPETSSAPALQPPATPTEDGVPWGWIALAGLGLLVGGSTVLAHLEGKQRQINHGVSAFEAKVRRLRELAKVFPTLTLDAPAPAAGYRDTASNAPGDPVAAFVAPLRARLDAAKRSTSARSIAEIEEINATLARKIAPLDETERGADNARTILSRVSGTMGLLTQRVAQGAATLHTLATRWPKESHAAARDALDRARTQSSWCVEERARLLASIDFDDIRSLFARRDALARLDDVVVAALNDADLPRRRLDELEAAEQRLRSLTSELHGASPAALAMSYPAASSSQLAALHEAHARAFEAHAAGNDLYLMIDALTALRNARLAVESARVAPPPSSYDASSSGYTASSNFTSSDYASSSYTSSDCASSDCASSDCASSDCASSDCASSDCASSDCASSSDCAGSSGDW